LQELSRLLRKQHHRYAEIIATAPANNTAEEEEVENLAFPGLVLFPTQGRKKKEVT